MGRSPIFKPFMLKVVDIVKDAPLFFYNSEDYSVMFYAGRHIHRLDAQAQSPYYLLIWQDEWESIEQNAGSAVVLLRSKSTDRQIPKRGHLLLVDVKNAEALPLAYSAGHRIET